MAVSPLSRLMLGLLAAWAAAGAAVMHREADLLAAAGWLLVPVAGLAVLGWLPAQMGAHLAVGRLRRSLGDPVAPFRPPAVSATLRGLGLGMALGGVWLALAGFVEAETPLLLFGGVTTAAGAAGAALGHAQLRRARRAVLRPWRALAQLHRQRHLLERPEEVNALFTVVEQAWAAGVEDRGEALRNRARPILHGLRDHAVTHLSELARQGRGPEALALLERWREAAPACEPLFAFLGLTPERLGGLVPQLETEHAHAWAEKRARWEPALAEANALLADGQPSQAIVRLDEVLLQVPDPPPPLLADLRRRALDLQSRARDLMTEAHRSAVAAAQAVSEPVIHPPSPVQELAQLEPPAPEALESAAALAREALTFARQHLDRADPDSAEGWLAHAEHHAANLPGPEGESLRGGIEDLRGRIALARAALRPRPRPVATGPLDADAILASYRAEHRAPIASITGRTTWDWLLLAAGSLLVLGFFLPWHGLVGVAWPLSGRQLPSLLRGTLDSASPEDPAMILLTAIQVVALYAVLTTGALAAVCGGLTLLQSRPAPLLFRALRVFLVVAWLGMAFSVWRLNARGPLEGAMSAAEEAPSLMLLRGALPGLWLLVTGLPVITVAGALRRTRRWGRDAGLL